MKENKRYEQLNALRRAMNQEYALHGASLRLLELNERFSNICDLHVVNADEYYDYIDDKYFTLISKEPTFEELEKAQEMYSPFRVIDSRWLPDPQSAVIYELCAR